MESARRPLASLRPRGRLTVSWDVPMFRETILAQLDRRKWSQYRLVQESGVSKTAVYEFLAGRRDLSGSNLERLCESLELVLKVRRNGT